MVVEEGTYEDLLAIGSGGLFHSLAAKQEEDQLEDAEKSEEVAADSPSGAPSLGEESFRSSAGAEVGNDGAEGEAAEPKKKKKDDTVKRLQGLYHPSHKPLLRLGLLAATACGVATGFMGVIIIQASYPFRDTFEPAALEREVMTWGLVAIGIGVFIHIVDTIQKIGFGIAGEGLTRRLRKLALRSLLHSEVGMFDFHDKYPQWDSNPHVLTHANLSLP